MQQETNGQVKTSTNDRITNVNETIRINTNDVSFKYGFNFDFIIKRLDDHDIDTFDHVSISVLDYSHNGLALCFSIIRFIF